MSRNLENLVKAVTKGSKPSKTDLRRSRKVLSDKIVNPCCVITGSVTLGITGPTGIIRSGGAPYNFTVTSSVAGVADIDVESISLVVNDAVVATQKGNAFSLAQTKSAVIPAVATVYYTVAVLRSGQSINSPIQQFTLSESAPVWSTMVQSQTAKFGQARHIIDAVFDADPDTLSVTFLNLPSFCTATMTPVTGLAGTEVSSAVIVDILVNPLAADAGTYSFTMVANDGSITTNKVVSLTVQSAARSVATTRPPVNVTMSNTGGSQLLGNPVFSQTIDAIQTSTRPSTPGIGGIGNSSGTTTPTINIVPTVGNLGKWIVLSQYRNTSAAGALYEESLVNIVTIN